jgi:hypothetical protein
MHNSKTFEFLIKQIMYEINANVRNCMGHYRRIFRNLVLMVRKLLWTGSQINFLIQNFISFFNSSTFLAVHLCIQLTTSNYGFFLITRYFFTLYQFTDYNENCFQCNKE